MKTTFYIKNKNLERLDEAAAGLKMKRNRLIMLLLCRISENNSFISHPNRTIRYQKGDGKTKWKTAHLKFDPFIYERVQDLRRNCKFSVSWLISFCIENILDELINDFLNKDKKNVDNYNHQFVCITRKFGDIQGFVTIWGIPELEHIKDILTE